MPFGPGANWSRDSDVFTAGGVNAEEEQSSAKACAQSGPHYRFLTLSQVSLCHPVHEDRNSCLRRHCTTTVFRGVIAPLFFV